MASTTIPKNMPAPKAGEGAWLWLFKQLTGPLILLLIIIHFVVNHTIGEGGLLSYQQIVNYYQIWIIPIMEGLFLALVVSHSLLGLRSILLDLRPSKSVMRVVDWVFVIVGIAAVVYGVWLIQAIVAAGAAA